MHVSSSLSVSRALNGGGVQSERIYRERERKRRQETDTRHLIGVQALTEYGLVTYGQETLVYFLIKPANLSVLSEASIGRRIYALMTVLKGVAEVEMLCLNSRESFEENKLFLRRRMEEEQNPVVRSLLEKTRSILTGYRFRWQQRGNFNHRPVEGGRRAGGSGLSVTN